MLRICHNRDLVSVIFSGKNHPSPNFLKTLLQFDFKVRAVAGYFWELGELLGSQGGPLLF